MSRNAERKDQAYGKDVLVFRNGDRHNDVVPLCLTIIEVMDDLGVIETVEELPGCVRLPEEGSTVDIGEKAALSLEGEMLPARRWSRI